MLIEDEDCGNYEGNLKKNYHRKEKIWIMSNKQIKI